MIFFEDALGIRLEYHQLQSTFSVSYNLLILCVTWSDSEHWLAEILLECSFADFGYSHVLWGTKFAVIISIQVSSFLTIINGLSLCF
jgi:hypothetical protein